MAQIVLDEATWLEARRQGIGGSDAGAVLGLDSFKSSFEVYGDKLGLIPPKEDTEQMRLGRDLESYVAARFAEATGKTVIPNGKTLYRSDEHPWMQATPDFWIDGEFAGLECKTMGQLADWDIDAGVIPPAYYAQCVHCMAVTGADRWYLAIYKFSTGLRWFEIKRDMLEIEALVKAESEFWFGCVQAQLPPVLTGTDSESAAIKAITAKADPGKEIPLFHMTDAVARAYELGEQLAAMERERDALVMSIKLEMGDAEYGTTPEYKVTWKQGAKNRTFKIRRVNE